MGIFNVQLYTNVNGYPMLLKTCLVFKIFLNKASNVQFSDNL